MGEGRTLALLLHSGTPLKDSGEGISQWAELWVRGCLSCLEGNMARGLDPYSFMAMANGLVRDLEGTQLEIWWQEGLKKRYLDRPLQMGSVVKIFVSRVNAHQREISTQCDLNNWVDKMIHSMYVHGLINKATWQHGWRFCVVPVTWTHQGQFGYGHCWIPNLPTNTELPIWYHSLRRPAKYLVAGLLHWITFILEAHFFSHWSR